MQRSRIGTTIAAGLAAGAATVAIGAGVASAGPLPPGAAPPSPPGQLQPRPAPPKIEPQWKYNLRHGGDTTVRRPWTERWLGLNGGWQTWQHPS